MDDSRVFYLGTPRHWNSQINARSLERVWYTVWNESFKVMSYGMEGRGVDQQLGI